MAKKKMTSQDLLKLLQSGAGYGAGSDPRLLLATLLANPQTLASLRSRAAEDVSPYTRFDPRQVYDPSTAFNDVLVEYQTLRPELAPVAKKFFTVYQAGGANEGALTEAEAMIDTDYADLDEGQRIQLKEQLGKDADRFAKAEASKAKKQMSAFYQMRKKQGLKGAPGAGDVGSFLEAQTGLAGIGSLPSSYEEAAKQRAGEFEQKLRSRKGRSEESIARMVAQFEKQFAGKAKKSKKSPVSFASKEVLAKLIGGL